MSVREIGWRIQGKVRDRLDRIRLAKLSGYPSPQRVIGRAAPTECNSKALGEHLSSKQKSERHSGYLPVWRDRLVERADRIAVHRLNLFDLQDVDLGTPIDWHYDYKARKSSPRIFAQDIDYRDYAVTGDCKFVWEVSRHYQLVTLGRAYRLTGDHRYAEAVVEQLESWIEQNPFAVGMNWRSPLELAIRLINWVWACELIQPSGLLDQQRMNRWLPVIWRHCWEISRKYSRFSSANNHLIGEAAGVFIASCYFSQMKDAPRWRKKSWSILQQQMIQQTYPDGCNREQAMGYHLFVLEFFTLSLLAARRSGMKVEPTFERMLQKMYAFLAVMCEAGDPPMFGDADDGYVLDLANGRPTPRELVGLGAVLFQQADYTSIAGDLPEQVFWLLGPRGCEDYESLQRAASDRALGCHAFPQTGLYLLQTGRPQDGSAVSVTLDCGELGFGSIAAHGHADALSVTLRVAGRDILVDPGTYDYFTYPQWREHFRSTRAHNTVVVDEQNQSEIQGPFLWGQRACCKCLHWQPGDGEGELVAEHDGYLGLGVIHRRHLRLANRVLEIRDALTGSGRHKFQTYLHLAPNLELEWVDEHRVAVAGVGRAVVFEFDPALSVQVVRPPDPSLLGWFSSGYHRKEPALTIVGSFNWQERHENLIRVILD